MVLGIAMKAILLLVFSLIALTACADNGIEVAKETRENETYYLAHGNNCKLLWRVRFYQEGFGVRQDGTHCALPLAKRKAYWAALLKRLMLDTNNLQGILGFQWGPLEQAASDKELSQRLMRAAAHAKEWDSKRGVVRGQARAAPNFLVEKLLGRAKVFAEFTETFAEHGVLITVRDVEEVLIKPVLLDGLGTVTVPYGGLVSFSVKRQSGK